jgi:hypothetical protein
LDLNRARIDSLEDLDVRLVEAAAKDDAIAALAIDDGIREGPIECDLVALKM